MFSDPFIKFLLLIIFYVISLLILRLIGIGKKIKIQEYTNCCPDCESPLIRIKRTKKDIILFHITFRIFNWKRYLCNECGWEGLRWEENFK